MAREPLGYESIACTAAPHLELTNLISRLWTFIAASHDQEISSSVSILYSLPV